LEPNIRGVIIEVPKEVWWRKTVLQQSYGVEKQGGNDEAHLITHRNTFGETNVGKNKTGRLWYVRIERKARYGTQGGTSGGLALTMRKSEKTGRET